MSDFHQINVEIGIHPHVYKEYDFQISKEEKIKNVIKVETQLGIFAVKKSDVQSAQIKRMNEILQFLEKQSFSATSIVPNKFGDVYVPTESGVIYVTKWMEGKSLGLHEPSHLNLLIKKMAHLHKVGFNFEPNTLTYSYVDEMTIRNVWEERIHWLTKYQKKLKRKATNTTFEHVFLSYIPFLQDWAEEALEHLNEWILDTYSIETMRKTICHGRIHHRNAVIASNKNVYLIDFDHVSIDTPVRDIAYFIRFYILNKEHRMWATFWLDQYEKINPLLIQEKRLLAIYLLFPERMLTLAKNYEQKEKKWSEEMYLKKLQIRWEQMKETIWFVDQHQWLN